VYLHRCNGDGTLQGPSIAAQFNVGGTRLAVGDLNSDGKLDFVTPSASFLNNGNAVFTLGSQFMGAPHQLADPVLADFNHDGKLDMATPQASSGAVRVLLGLGGGSFMPGITFTAGPNAKSLAVGDFNGDGHIDLAVAGQGLSILRNNGFWNDQVSNAAFNVKLEVEQ
jgi:hypothetical protein